MGYNRVMTPCCPIFICLAAADVDQKSTAASSKELYSGPQTGNPRNEVGAKWEYGDPGRCVPILFLPYSWVSKFWGPRTMPFKLSRLLADLADDRNDKHVADGHEP